MTLLVKFILSNASIPNPIIAETFKVSDIYFSFIFLKFSFLNPTLGSSKRPSLFLNNCL